MLTLITFQKVLSFNETPLLALKLGQLIATYAKFCFFLGDASQNSLDAVTLRLLGDDGNQLSTTSAAIHKDIVPIWSAIFKDGLKDSTWDSLIAKYPAAQNCFDDTP